MRFLLVASFLSGNFNSFTNINDFQTALNACVSGLSVHDWEMLTELIQIPEVMVPMAYAMLTELTIQEVEVSLIFYWLVIVFQSI